MLTTAGILVDLIAAELHAYSYTGLISFCLVI